MTELRYPTRCRIVDIAGESIGDGFVAKTPNVSRPYIGMEGLAELVDDWDVRITLSNGVIIHGYECWWEPIE
jgi:hypothetical protein